MDTRQFADGYKTPASNSIPEVRGNVNPEVTRLMEGPRKWASFFDDQLVNYLKNEQTDAPEDIYRELELEYSTGWLNQFLYQTVMDVRKLGPDDMDAQKAANELHFHVMNRELLPMWHRLLLPDFRTGFSIDELYVMQVNLAMHAAEISRAAKAAKDQDAARGIRSGMVGVFNGQLTEIDTAVVMLEKMKEDALLGESRLVFVPAPQKFEAGYRNRRRTIDFVLLDIEERQARGIQVKTRINSLNEEPIDRPLDEVGTPHIPMRRYDPEFVTLIDGMVDLGNSRKEGRGTSAAPGLVSLDLLQHDVSVQKLSHHPAFRNQLRGIMIAKGIARELSVDRKSFLPFATNHMAERVLTDLYDNKTPS